MSGPTSTETSAGQLPSEGPWVWVQLPDRQEIRGQLLAQVQASTGEWGCLVVIQQWEHVVVEGHDRIQPVEKVVPAPASHIRKIDAAGYEGIVTRRHPSPSPVRPQQAPQFWLQRLRMPSPQHSVLHTDTCWVRSNNVLGAPPVLCLEEARILMADSYSNFLIEYCQACEPEKLLNTSEQ